MSEPAKKEETSGAPAWVMTFADLMSLLMCFFVLLLSFSELDLQKYKQIAGSMKQAFGVQREIKANEMPKGTSIIAREFSPGRPSPSPLKQIQQSSIDDAKQTLEFTDAMTKKEGEDTDSGEVGEGADRTPVQRKTQDEESKEFLAEGGEGNISLDINVPTDGKGTDISEIDPAVLAALDPELLANYSQAVGTEPETAEDAIKLLKALTDEVKSGMIEIETEGKKILVRIREKGSFPSGSAKFRQDFMPVLEKLRNSLKTIEGRVVIAGHTDNVPIKTHRFRSNWELSSSRAVSVVHELLKTKELSMNRFIVEGHAEAHPIAPNDTTANRALNRRVELIIAQGDDTHVERSAKQLKPEDLKPTQTKQKQEPKNPFDSEPKPKTSVAKKESQKKQKATEVKMKEIEERIKKFKSSVKKTNKQE